MSDLELNITWTSYPPRLTLDSASSSRPALNEALKALDTLSSKEIAEVKALMPRSSTRPASDLGLRGRRKRAVGGRGRC